MNKNILITGAGGTLGRLLLKALPKKYTIKALSTQKENLIKEFESYETLNFFNEEDFYKNKIDFKDLDCVLHLAFARTQNGNDLVKSIDFSKEIFKKAKEARVKNIVHVSSQSIYGNLREIPSVESDIPNPFDFYGIAKYACEELGNEICENSETKITHIRLASLLSPFLKERIVNKMIEAALEKNEITIVGGAQIFSYLDTRDAINAIIFLLDSLSSFSSRHENIENVYNLGSDEHYDIMHIAQSIRKILAQEYSKEITINLQEKDINTKIKLDCNKFNTKFNWKAKYTLEETIYWILAGRTKLL